MTDLSEHLDFILHKAEQLGATEVAARIIESRLFQHRFAKNLVTVSKQWSERKIQVFLAIQNRIASTSIQTVDKALTERILKSTIKVAQNSEPSPFYGGLNPEKHQPTELKDVYDPGIMDYVEKSGEHVNMAIQTAQEHGAKRSAGVFLFGKSRVIGRTSHDISYEYERSSYEFNIRSFVSEEASGQGLATGVLLSKIEDRIRKAAEQAGRLAHLSQNPKMGSPGQYDVILSPIVAADLLGNLGSSANPLLIMMNFSPLGDKIGSQILPENMHIYDWGNAPEGLSSAPIDFEGVARQKTPIVENGVLKNLIHNYSSAKLMGAKSTGNGELIDFGGSQILAPSPTNIVFNNGDHSLEELMELESDGRPIIYVTSNWYTRWTNMVESTFSTIPRDGMFLIENGEISQPVKKLRISENLLQMCKRIVALGNDQQQVHWWEVEIPTFISSVRISDVRFTAATK